MKTADESAAAVQDRRPQRESAVPPARDAVGVASDSAVAPAKAPRPDVAPAPADSLHDFLAELLAEQNRLDTPVVRASHAYDQSKVQNPKSKIFESLIPLSAPRAGEQYAFEVDLDSCTGCKACVSACHALNGLDENETWRDTGQLLGCGSAAPVAQTITTACHHCEDPGCLNGCPVLAYEKDPLTGIVRHLDDQCIGCQYCILKCPYDVPKYNARLGIVRKCDLCHQRLAHGEAPACAQACPTQAIRVVVVSTSKSAPAAKRWAPLSPAATETSDGCGTLRESSVVAGDSDVHPAGGAFLSAEALAKAERPDAGFSRAHASVERSGTSEPASQQSKIENPKSTIAFPGPDPAYTRPTTRYVTAREFPREMRAADANALRPQHAHWPLVLMLTLLPWAICLQALSLTPLGEIASQQTALASAPSPWTGVRVLRELVTYYVTNPAERLALLPLALGALGLAAATFHLGQPLRAWRVFLGLRTSWFSREAVLFGAWFGGTAALALAPLLARWPALGSVAALVDVAPVPLGVPLVGLAGLLCSVMIYVDTRRSFWRATFTAPRFFLGGASLALATLAIGVGGGASGSFAYYAKVAAALLLIAKLAVEFASVRGDSASARLQRGPFVDVLCVRLGCAVGAVAMLFAAAPGATGSVITYYVMGAVSLALLLTGEIAERYLFFRAVDAPKMPGYATR